ncbi:predicted protein [Postia placenta Mad-698-R]|nr:predicted protein [Postia placenta Mad-698-R]
MPPRFPDNPHFTLAKTALRLRRLTVKCYLALGTRVLRRTRRLKAVGKELYEHALRPLLRDLGLVSPRATIHSLPYETLAHIFALGRDPSPCRACSRKPWRLRDGNPCACKLPFPHLVSSVCCHWRTIALAMPQLWTTVPVTSKATMSMMSVYLKRSRGRPIDVNIVIRHPDNLHETDDHYPVLRHLLLEHAARWRRVSIICDRPLIKPFLLALLNQVPFPMLEALEIDFPSLHPYLLIMEDDPWPKRLLAKGAPRLREVSILQAYLTKFTMKPLASLEKLELMTSNWALPHLKVISVTSPRLTHLTLFCKSEYLPTSTHELEAFSGLLFPSLTHLRLRHTVSGIPLLRILEAPELTVLQLEDLYFKRNEIVVALLNALRKGGNPAAPCKFPCISSLRFEIPQTKTEGLPEVFGGHLLEFLRLFPAVEQLAIQGFRTEEIVRSMTSTALPDVVLPRLKRFVILGHPHAEHFDTLQTLWQWRAGAGAPITSVSLIMIPASNFPLYSRHHGLGLRLEWHIRRFQLSPRRVLFPFVTSRRAGVPSYDGGIHAGADWMQDEQTRRGRLGFYGSYPPFSCPLENATEMPEEDT